MVGGREADRQVRCEWMVPFVRLFSVKSLCSLFGSLSWYPGVFWFGLEIIFHTRKSVEPEEK